MQTPHVKFAICVVVLCFLCGCATLIQSQRVVDNIGRSYIAVEPTMKTYRIGDATYVEFAKSRYKDYMPLAGEDIHVPSLGRDNNAPGQLVYLKVDGLFADPVAVFSTLLTNQVALVASQNVSTNLADLIEFPNAFETYGNDVDGYYSHYNTRGGYPLVLESKQNALWYIVWPLQIPAFIVDVGTTLAFVPVAIICWPIQSVVECVTEE